MLNTRPRNTVHASFSAACMATWRVTDEEDPQFAFLCVVRFFFFLYGKAKMGEGLNGGVDGKRWKVVP